MTRSNRDYSLLQCSFVSVQGAIAPVLALLAPEIPGLGHHPHSGDKTSRLERAATAGQMLYISVSEFLHMKDFGEALIEDH